MVEVIIPFLPEFEEDLKFGNKCMTTRTKKYGDVGDTFTAFGSKFVVKAVFKLRLWRVAYDFCRAEGFQSPTDFIKVWNKIHPRKVYDATEQQYFWVHIFTPNYE